MDSKDIVLISALDAQLHLARSCFLILSYLMNTIIDNICVRDTITIDLLLAELTKNYSSAELTYSFS